jgi:putative tryptophan/tyrosine transport system substrate-binding protein
LAARSQQANQLRRIGMLLFGFENDPSALSRAAAFKGEFKRLGWVEGRNVQIDMRFAGGNPDRFRAYAGELVRLAPDLIVTQSAPAARAVQAATKSIPLVFVEVGDAMASGLVHNIARPEANSTGITQQPFSISGKWLELLKEAVPQLTRVLLLENFDLEGRENAYAPAIEAAAKAYAVEVRTLFYSNVMDIERALGDFALEPNGGVIVVPPTPTDTDLPVVKRLLVQHRLPAVYQHKLVIETGGGLISYGADILGLFRSGASYADRILRGTKPGDLPVQFSSRFELVINLKTAKALGLTIPETLLATADELIQ